MSLCKSFVPADRDRHDLKSFDCGKDKMNEFLSRYAIKNTSLGLSSTWVLTSESEGVANREVAACYTLASTTVSREEVPVKKTKLPSYPVPVVLVARLAIAKDYQGQGLGEKTLIQALRHAVQLCERGLPAFGLVLDVLDEDALAFYRKFELFDELADEPMRLFAGMGTLRQI